MNPITKTSRRAAIGGLLILSGGGVLLNRSVIQPGIERRKARRDALKRTEEHLSRSDRTSAACVEERLDDIRDLFTNAQEGVPAFSKEMLGWGSKWKLIKDRAQFWKDGDEHKQFVEASFAALVFKPDDLAEVIRKAVEDFVARDGEAVNNQLLTSIREDVPIELLGYQGAPDRFELDASDTINLSFVTSAQAAYGDIGKDAGTFAVSSVAEIIAGKVLVKIGASIAARIGLSATIVGAGAAASLFTLGLSLIATIVIGLVLGWLVNFFTDPVGNLAASVQEKLKKLETLVIEGAPVSESTIEGNEADESAKPVIGLRQELERIAEMQSRSRREAISNLLGPNT